MEFSQLKELLPLLRSLEVDSFQQGDLKICFAYRGYKECDLPCPPSSTVTEFTTPAEAAPPVVEPAPAPDDKIVQAGLAQCLEAEQDPTKLLEWSAPNTADTIPLTGDVAIEG